MKKLFLVQFFVLIVAVGFAKIDTSSYYASSRLNYYTNEEVGDILVYVPERLKDVRISIDLVFEYHNLNKGYPAFSGGVTNIPFPMDKLREGLCEITVSFYENEKWVDSRKVWVDVRSHKDNAVKIDYSSGALYTGGLPVIPAGLHTSFPVDLNLVSHEAAAGFNMLTAEQDLLKKSARQRKEYMDRMASLGIRVNYNLSGLTEQKEMSATVNEIKEAIGREIEVFRDHPALLSWYIAADPDNPGKISSNPDSLKEIYNFIKKADPYHPVVIRLGSPRNFQYLDAADIIMVRPAPIPQGSLLEVKDYTRILSDYSWLQKPTWIMPQNSGGKLWEQREPTPQELRAMSYMAVIYGAKGFSFTKAGTNGTPKSPQLWDACRAVAMELALLTPEILSTHPAPDMIAEQPSIHSKAWNRAGIVTIIIVNDKNEPMKFRVQMKDIDLSIPADVLFENRRVEIVSGGLEDFIDGYGTRIYRFDARLKPDWKKDIHPGNLTVDPGFEDLTNGGIPTASYVLANSEPGSTYFLDPRRYFMGEYSLRMNNPVDQANGGLLFYNVDLSHKQSYTISIMARTGISSNLPGSKKERTVRCRLGLGETIMLFTCSESWEKYEVNNIRVPESKKVSPFLEMASRGTAWFDNLLVYPDMELKESKGDAGKFIVEIISVHKDVKIFYTLDGTEPSQLSAEYIIPLEITANDKLKAVAFSGDKAVGYIER